MTLLQSFLDLSILDRQVRRTSLQYDENRLLQHMLSEGFSTIPNPKKVLLSLRIEDRKALVKAFK